MKRGGPLKRTGALKRGAPMKRGGKVSAQSKKRKDEAEERWAVRQHAMRRAKFTCEAPDGAFGMEHGGPLDCHETIARSVRPGSHLEPELTMILCRLHHAAVDLYPEWARELGLAYKSWEYDLAKRE